MTQGQGADLLGQVVAVVADDRAEGARTADELRRTARTVTSAAGALLLVHLLARTRVLVAGLNLVGAGAALGQLPVDGAGQEVAADVGDAEDGVRQVHVTGGLAVELDDREFHYASPPSVASTAGASSAGVSAG